MMHKGIDAAHHQLNIPAHAYQRDHCFGSFDDCSKMEDLKTPGEVRLKDK
jgi:hypothetical protein